ncbi:hypothetical protein E4U41_000152, partial [Claviceps citrina]
MAAPSAHHEALQPIHPSMAGKLDPVFEQLYNDNVAQTPLRPIDLALLRTKYSELYSYGTGPAPEVGRIYDDEMPLDDDDDNNDDDDAAAAPASTKPKPKPKPKPKLKLRVYEPASEGPWPVHLDFHGGGWGLGDLDTEAHICRHICAKAGVVVVDVAYRLVPEHAFPAGITDGFAALRWVRDMGERRFGIRPGSISLGGVSAGGCIALA